MTPGPFFGYTASWNEKMDKSRAFVALIETLQNQIVFLSKKFYREMSIFAWSSVVLLTTDGPFAQPRNSCVQICREIPPEDREFHRDMQCYSRGGTQNGGNQVSDQ
jgi:hypothetical protein